VCSQGYFGKNCQGFPKITLAAHASGNLKNFNNDGPFCPHFFSATHLFIIKNAMNRSLKILYELIVSANNKK
jgi:hypothetical protein